MSVYNIEWWNVTAKWYRIRWYVCGRFYQPVSEGWWWAKIRGTFSPYGSNNVVADIHFTWNCIYLIINVQQIPIDSSISNSISLTIAECHLKYLRLPFDQSNLFSDKKETAINLKKLITYNQTQFCIRRIAANQFQANGFDSGFSVWLRFFFLLDYLSMRHKEMFWKCNLYKQFFLLWLVELENRLDGDI